MDRKQFYTFCKHCGKQIIMTRNTETGRFTPCDPEIKRFIPDDEALDVFINIDGQTVHGIDGRGMGDMGYKKHSLSCKGRKSA